MVRRGRRSSGNWGDGLWQQEEEEEEDGTLSLLNLPNVQQVPPSRLVSVFVFVFVIVIAFLICLRRRMAPCLSSTSLLFNRFPLLLLSLHLYLSLSLSLSLFFARGGKMAQSVLNFLLFNRFPLMLLSLYLSLSLPLSLFLCFAWKGRWHSLSWTSYCSTGSSFSLTPRSLFVS